jgi:PKD repeat protein
MSATLIAQTNLKFVTYGNKAEPSKGDDNYIQVINIQLPNDYTGKAFLRIYDMSCGSVNDVASGTWNSRFRFSLYKNEHKENEFLKVPSYVAKVKDQIISHFEIGNDERFFNKWYSFYNLNSLQSDKSIFSLVVEGVDGNDANKYEIFVSSDSLENKSIDGVVFYSYEPTIPLLRSSSRLSFKFMPREDDQVTLHLFDFDGTKTFFSSLIKDELPVLYNNTQSLSSIKIPLEVFENQNYCTLDIGPEKNLFNDITFHITDKEGNNLPIVLPAFEKPASTIPTARKKIIYPECNTVEIDYSISTSNTGGTLDYLWFIDDKEKLSGEKIIRSFKEPGKYNFKTLVEEKNDVITRAKLEKFQIVINSQPTAKIDSLKVSSPNKPVFFDGSNSFDKDGYIKKYLWWFGDGLTGEESKTTHSYSSPGRYVVKLKIEDDYEGVCNFNTDSTVVTINAQPVAITKEQILFGAVDQALQFDASKSYDPDGKIVNYLWDFGKYGVKEGPIVENSFKEPGTYQINLTVRDNSETDNNKSNFKLKAVINSAPKANAGVSRIVKAGEPVHFDASNSKDFDGTITGYFWDFGDGTSAEGKLVDHTYTKHGKYIIKLKIKDDSGLTNDYGVDSISVAVNKHRHSESTDKIKLPNSSAKFDGTREYEIDGVESRYFWNFGDGNIGEGKIITHNYKTPGLYSVVLRVADNIQSENRIYLDTINVMINKRPIADPGPDYTIAPGQTLSFDNYRSVDSDGKIVKTRWFIDNLFISEQNKFDYKFNLPGKYIITLEVTDDFVFPLIGVDFCVVTVNNAPNAKINYQSKTVPNQKIKFDASKSYDSDGNINEYNWIFSDGEMKSGKIVEKSFQSPGLFTAILKVKDDSKASNSLAQDTVIVKVNNTPVIKTKEYIETCSSIVSFDASASYDPDGDPIIFTWDFPGEPNRIGSGVTIHNFKESGIIPVVVTIDDGMGLLNSVVKKTITVNLHKPPVANAGTDTTVCAGEIVILSGLKSLAADKSTLEYEWIFDDSTKLTGSNVFKVFKKEGLYKVDLRVKDNSGLLCNADTDSKIIKVVGAPIANAGDDLEACANTPVEFDGSKSTDVDGIVNSYEWDFGDGESGGGVNPIHIYNKPGTYKVSLTITGDVKGECDNLSKDDLNVTVIEAPIASFTSRDSIPDNYETIFNASLSSTSAGKIIKYEWDFGDGTKAEGEIVKHKYEKSGNFNVTSKIVTDLKNRCNSSMVSKSVYVNAKPTAKGDVKLHAAVNESLTFDASESFDPDGKISQYKWDFGDESWTEGISAVHSFTAAGRYKVVLSVTDESKVENNFDKQIFEILINKEPKATFELPEYSYTNEEITLDASRSTDGDGIITSYEWFADDVTISKEAFSKIKFITAGTKKIRLLVKDDSKLFNEASEITRYIDVVDYPKVTLPDSIIACVNETISLVPTISKAYDDPRIKYIWRNDAGEQLYNEKIISIKFEEPGKNNYHLELIDDAGKVVTKATSKVIVKVSPVLRKINDTDLFIGKVNDEFVFDASNYFEGNISLLKINWNFGNGSSSNLPVVVHRYLKEGRFKVEIEVDDQLNTKCSKAKIGFYINVMSK